jgi:hypothetical protein
MTLLRKGSRRISVDGEAYRWTVSVDEDFQRVCWPTVRDIHWLVVESPASPGRTLSVEFPLGDHSEGLGHAIKPGLVASVVRAANQQGWPREGTGAVRRYWRGAKLMTKEEWLESVRDSKPRL